MGGPKKKKFNFGGGPPKLFFWLGPQKKKKTQIAKFSKFFSQKIQGRLGGGDGFSGKKIFFLQNFP